MLSRSSLLELFLQCRMPSRASWILRIEFLLGFAEKNDIGLGIEIHLAYSKDFQSIRLN